VWTFDGAKAVQARSFTSRGGGAGGGGSSPISKASGVY
jgi:hypothetical protein